MITEARKRISPEDWIGAAIRELDDHGVDGIKVVRLARKLNMTSGSFYWHFKDLPELLNALLRYWEVEMTDRIIAYSRAFDGPPEKRILDLMLNVIEHDAASLDHAISVWARRDPAVKDAYERTINKRFDHAAWMFQQVGFDKRQAAIRGRLMVAYLMGESSAMLKSNSRWKSIVKDEFKILLDAGVNQRHD